MHKNQLTLSVTLLSIGVVMATSHCVAESNSSSPQVSNGVVSNDLTRWNQQQKAFSDVLRLSGLARVSALRRLVASKDNGIAEAAANTLVNMRDISSFHDIARNIKRWPSYLQSHLLCELIDLEYCGVSPDAIYEMPRVVMLEKVTNPPNGAQLVGDEYAAIALATSMSAYDRNLVFRSYMANPSSRYLALAVLRCGSLTDIQNAALQRVHDQSKDIVLKTIIETSLSQSKEDIRRQLQATVDNAFGELNNIDFYKMVMDLYAGHATDQEKASYALYNDDLAILSLQQYFVEDMMRLSPISLKCIRNDRAKMHLS